MISITTARTFTGFAAQAKLGSKLFVAAGPDAYIAAQRCLERLAGAVARNEIPDQSCSIEYPNGIAVGKGMISANLPGDTPQTPPGSPTTPPPGYFVYGQAPEGHTSAQCPECSSLYMARAHQLYCSGRCRARAHRRQTKETAA